MQKEPRPLLLDDDVNVYGILTIDKEQYEHILLEFPIFIDDYFT